MTYLSVGLVNMMQYFSNSFFQLFPSRLVTGCINGLTFFFFHFPFVRSVLSQFKNKNPNVFLQEVETKIKIFKNAGVRERWSKLCGEQVWETGHWGLLQELWVRQTVEGGGWGGNMAWKWVWLLCEHLSVLYELVSRTGNKPRPTVWQNISIFTTWCTLEFHWKV